MVIAEIATVLIVVVICLIVGVLLLLAVVSMVGGTPLRTLEVQMAKQEMRAIKRRAVRQMYRAEAESRSRAEHGDVIDGTVVED